MVVSANIWGCAALALSLPFWLPRAVIALRMKIFTRINGDEGIAVPGKLVDATHFKELYAHPAANGRSRGAALSDLFWYWLSPGPEMHQEHLEAGERYDEVAHTTRRLLAIPKKVAAEAATRSASRVLDELEIKGQRLVRLRDLMMPIWADFYYSVVFDEPCPRTARELIVANANDVVIALKMTSLRHMKKRHRLTRFLKAKLERGELPRALPAGLSLEECAFYLQGVFFNTAIVQTSEAMAHLFMAIAQHDDVQRRLVDESHDHRYLDHVIAETLRLYPLFGIAHRITSADIHLAGMPTIPKGSVLCFNYPAFHAGHNADAKRFDPDRWLTTLPRDTNYLPFGVQQNRSCPAQGIALVTMRAVAEELLSRFAVHSTAHHARSLPNRGPCLLEARQGKRSKASRKARLLFMRARDEWEDIFRSFEQLVFGTYMVWDAKRLRLCGKYFDTVGGCPMHRQTREG